MAVTKPCSSCGRLVAVGGSSLPQPTCRDCRRVRRTRPCEGCGESFYNKDLRQRFCSSGCYKSASGLGSKRRSCEVCGKEYIYTYSEQRTCGRECGVALRRTVTASLPAEVGSACKRCRIAAPHSHVAAVNCLECSKLFIARGNRSVCSSKCQRSRANRMTGEYITARYHSDPEFRDRVLAASHLRRADKLGVADDAIRTMSGLIAYLMKRDRGRCGICRKPIRARKGPMRPSVDHIIPLARGGTHELANLQAAHYRCNLSKNDRGGGEQLLLVG